MFLVIDFVVGCKMKTVSSELTKQEMESLEDINHTNVNLKEQE